MTFTNTGISKAIIESYTAKLLGALKSDVLIAGAGPSGLVAAYLLAGRGLNVTIVEKRLSPGGGIWGGGMAMNDAVVQKDARDLLEEMGIPSTRAHDDMYVVDTMEMASGLCFKAIQAGARILNLTAAEDICVREGRVTGLVINRTTVYETLPVDPLMLDAKATIDATGHEFALVAALLKRGIKIKTRTGAPLGEGPMDAPEGERFVVENTGEVYPGLLVSGMSVCATFGGPRMGPIFGGMLLSGRKVAEIALETANAR